MHARKKEKIPIHEKYPYFFGYSEAINLSLYPIVELRQLHIKASLKILDPLAYNYCFKHKHEFT